MKSALGQTLTIGDIITYPTCISSESKINFGVIYEILDNADKLKCYILTWKFSPENNAYKYIWKKVTLFTAQNKCVVLSQSQIDESRHIMIEIGFKHTVPFHSYIDLSVELTKVEDDRYNDENEPKPFTTVAEAA